VERRQKKYKVFLTSLVLQMAARVIPQAFPGIAFQGSRPGRETSWE